MKHKLELMNVLVMNSEEIRCKNAGNYCSPKQITRITNFLVDYYPWLSEDDDEEIIGYLK